jgi:hypothetical protein
VRRSQIKRGHSSLKTALSWQLAQHQVARLVREVEAAGARVLRISFERLSEQPRTVLAEILEHVRLQCHEGGLTPRPEHVIGGAPRDKRGGSDTIEASTDTRQLLPLRARLVLKLVNNRYAGPIV